MPKGGCDCYLLDRQAIDVLLKLDEKNSSLTLQVLWIGFKSDNVYFHRKDREIGESKWTLSKKSKLVIDSMMSFSYFPIKFMSSLGVIMAILAFIWIIEVLIEFFWLGVPVQGWSTLMCLVLFSSGMILLMLGVLGEYLWRTLDATRNRPVYIVDSIKEAGTKE